MAGFADLSSWTSLLSAALNALPNLAQATSAIITPPTSPSRPFYIDLRINLASLTPAAGASLSVHILPAVDNAPTNFADLTGVTLVAVQPLTAGAGAKYAYLEGLRCPVVPFKVALINNAGVALAGTGNTVEYITKTES